jgi:hypothetical protein
MIFNGSEARRPLGMAEVSLTFRNVGASRANGNGHGGNGHLIAPAGGNGGDRALASHGGYGRGVATIPGFRNAAVRRGYRGAAVGG